MRFLFLNQTFPPDLAASGRYLADLAQALAAEGHEVTVLTSRRSYEDPARILTARETWRGIHVIRLWSTGFGKSGKLRRATDFGSFLLSCAWRCLVSSRPDAVIALTSPPLVSVIAALTAALKGSRFYYWVMDLNPDEAIAAGWLKPHSPAARILECLSRWSLRRATRVLALDRLMQQRILAKNISPERVTVAPLWAQEQAHFDAAAREHFRRAHQLTDKFVVMYSGNHSPVHPLTTLLEAARKLQADAQVVFCFIGGGSLWRSVQAFAETSGLTNVLCLPYQDAEQLHESLSAADLQVVVMGNAMPGLVHPCKIYNILAVGAPVLYIGPQPNYAAELLGRLPREYPVYEVPHGAVDEVCAAVHQARSAPPTFRDLPPVLRAEGSRERRMRAWIRLLTAEPEPRQDRRECAGAWEI